MHWCEFHMPRIKICYYIIRPTKNKGVLLDINILMAPFYTPASTKLKGGVYWFHVCLSICPSICGWNCVHPVSSTILAGSISHLYMLSSNFWKCVRCTRLLQNSKINFFGNFFKFIILTLTWGPIWINSKGQQGIFSEWRYSSCYSCSMLSVTHLRLQWSDSILSHKYQ